MFIARSNEEISASFDKSAAEAQEAFERVVSQYPDSTKAPGALFKIGRLQQASGDTAAARSSYQRVLDDYPASPAAGLARQRLDQLGR